MASGCLSRVLWTAGREALQEHLVSTLHCMPVRLCMHLHAPSFVQSRILPSVHSAAAAAAGLPVQPFCFYRPAAAAAGLLVQPLCFSRSSAAAAAVSIFLVLLSPWPLYLLPALHAVRGEVRELAVRSCKPHACGGCCCLAYCVRAFR